MSSWRCLANPFSWRVDSFLAAKPGIHLRAQDFLSRRGQGVDFAAVEELIVPPRVAALG